jgi:putative membrane protein
LLILIVSLIPNIRKRKKLISLGQGIVIGLSIVLPGISGGTVLIILGIYGDAIRDISQFRLAPHKVIILGIIAGIFLGGQILAQLLVFYPSLTATFFLGILLASTKAVFRERPSVTPVRALILILGFLAGFLMVEGSFHTMELVEVSWPYLFLCGAISSAAMLVPGISGSAFLIVLGVYSNLLFYLQAFRILELLIFALGCLLGMYAFSKVIEKIYFKYQAPCSYLFAGLIVGSTRILFPAVWRPAEAIVLVIGFCLVWLLEGGKKSGEAV